MNFADYDIAGLADYLHITPSQAAKMADRGKVPGRKVGGQWRFSPAEIHHWLEERLGAPDEDELADVEDLLERRRQAHREQHISLAEMLRIEAIGVPLTGRSGGKIISAMVELAARTGLLWDPQRMEEAVLARENLHPTALDNGVALLHPRRPMKSILAESFLAFGRASSGIPFGGGRGVLTDLFFLICSTDDSVHLRTLARLSRLVGDPETLALLRVAESAEEVHRVVAEFEEKGFPDD